MERMPSYRKVLHMSGLKPSDYYLFSQEKAYFCFDMRRLFVLGLRVLYAAQHGQITREQVLEFAQQIAQEDMDSEDAATRPVYKEFSRI